MNGFLKLLWLQKAWRGRANSCILTPLVRSINQKPRFLILFSFSTLYALAAPMAASRTIRTYESGCLGSSGCRFAPGNY